MRFIPILAVLIGAALATSAQTIGNYTLNGTQIAAVAPSTFVDLNSEATEDGTIGAVAARFNSNSCPDGFSVKFFRRSGNTLTSFAERGPFTATGSISLAELVPPVEVKRGDLIGIVSLKSCAPPAGQRAVPSKSAVQFAGNVSSASITSGITHYEFALGAYGALNAQQEIRTQVIPVAGAATGANNTVFRTDLFLTTVRNTPAAGRLVYHRELQTGFDNDPSVPFDVPAQGSKTFTNIVGTSLGLAGKGSIDVYTLIGAEPPYISARIYEDSPGGTKGFVFDAQTLGEALGGTFEEGVLFTPQDTARFRMNVGIRTLDLPTVLLILVMRSNGTERGFVTKSYPPNYFVQSDLKSLLNGLETQPGDTLVIYPSEGDAYVYGSIIDNFTNDPSIQFARPLQ